MNLDSYSESVRRQLESAAEAGGDEARALAGRLVTLLEAAIRLAVQDALSAAAEEITLELAPGSVELRLHGRELEFVVDLPPAERSEEPAETQSVTASSWRARTGAEGDEVEISRINLRLPEHVKSRVEQAAAEEGMSVNAWLVRATVAAVERSGPARRRVQHTPQGAQSYTGWVR